VKDRIGRLRGVLAGDGVADAVLVTDLTNVGYLTGFTGSAGRLLVPVDAAYEPLFLTDGRYEEQAAHELADAGVRAVIGVGRTMKAQTTRLRLALRRCRVARLGLESASVSWAAVEGYRTELAGVAVVSTSGLVEGLRRTKDVGEIARLARASAIADRALMSVLPLLGDKPSEVCFARALEAEMIRLGAAGESFPTIVAAGPPGSEPHHRAGLRPIVRGDGVICDFGALFDGYHSDMTRTVFVGEPNARQRRHFEAVRVAQADGVAQVRAGALARSVDAACRSALEPYGWTKRFVHGTGHGVGRLIHEAPWLGASSADVLAVDDVVTVEPGVYLRGRGGVRIEDTLVVTSRGAEGLTLAPKDLIVA
jgi:Xaa-Pro aminopeptidase